MKMKRLLVLAAVAGSLTFGGCATASQVPPDATPEQIEQVNAKNLEAIARNSALQTGITAGSGVISFLTLLTVTLLAGFVNN